VTNSITYSQGAAVIAFDRRPRHSSSGYRAHLASTTAPE
jgi:hypothetical protein